MGKLKNLLSNIVSLIKDMYQNFPITMIVVHFVTLIHVFGTDEFLEKFYDSQWIFMFGIFLIGTFFVETWFSKKRNRIIGGVISFIIGMGFRELSEMELAESTQLLFSKILITYTSILPLLTIYKTIRNTNVELKEYGIKVLSNLGKCTLIYILANIGIAIVITAFMELILDGEDFDILLRVLILLLGGYYVPALINSLTDMWQETGKFMKAIVMYVFTPVATFLIAIFYMFIAKSILNGKLFEEDLFGTLSVAFSLGLPVVLLLKNYDDSEKIKKFSKYFVYSFIPFIVLQIITMGIRVNAYGLTSARYMAYVLIFFEIIFIGLTIYKNSKYLDKILVVASILIFICVLTPLNFIDVPSRSQANRLKKIISKSDSFETLLDEEKEKCKEIYIYIRSSDGLQYIENKIDSATLEKIENYVAEYENSYDDVYYNEDIEREIEHVYLSAPIDGLNIKEYSTMYKLYRHYVKSGDYSQVVAKNNENEIEVEINFEQLIEEIIDADIRYESDEFFEKNNLIKTNNENIMVYLTSCNFEYDIFTEVVTDFGFDGYFLIK